MPSDVLEQLKPLADAESFAEHKALRAPQADPPQEPKREVSSTADDKSPKTEEHHAAPKEGKEPPAGSDTQDKPEGEKPRRNRSAEGRIAELIDENKGLKQRFEAMERELQQLRAKPVETPKPAAEAPKEDQPPKLSDFVKDPKYATYEEANEAWAEARDAWRDNRAKAEASKTEGENQKKAVLESLNRKVTEAKKTKTDFDDVARRVDWKQADPVMSQFILESDYSADFIYHFGQNPSELQRISQIQNPARRVAELAWIEKSFMATPEKPKPTAPPASRIAPPQKPIGGVSPPAPKPVSEAESFAEHKRLRNGR